MTDDRLALLELIEKRADADLVREMLHFAAGRVMELEMQACTRAAHGVRDPMGAKIGLASTRTGLILGVDARCSICPERPVSGVAGATSGQSRS